jgi:hypothetical protein
MALIKFNGGQLTLTTNAELKALAALIDPGRVKALNHDAHRNL